MVEFVLHHISVNVPVDGLELTAALVGISSCVCMHALLCIIDVRSIFFEMDAHPELYSLYM